MTFVRISNGLADVPWISGRLGKEGHLASLSFPKERLLKKQERPFSWQAG